MFRVLLSAVTALLLVIGVVLTDSPSRQSEPRLESSKPVVSATRTSVPAPADVLQMQHPLYFEPDMHGGYISQGSGTRVSLATSSVELRSRAGALTLRFIDAAQREPGGRTRLPGVSHDLTAADAAEWRRNIPNFSHVGYDALWPGVDAVFYGNGRHLEYDFIVAPGTTPDRIALALDGAEDLRVERDGRLTFKVGGELWYQPKPMIYQERDGQRETIEGGYRLADGQVGIEVAAYDATRPLVIDPVLTYSTVLGMENYEFATAIAVDDTGVYVAGTVGIEVPPEVIRSYGTSLGSSAFVQKISLDGRSVIFTTRFATHVTVADLAVDASHAIYLTGTLYSTSGGGITPVNAFQPSARGGREAYLVKFDADGSRVTYATWLGGRGYDEAFAIAVAANGVVSVGGITGSDDFPIANALQSSRMPPAYEPGTCYCDAFVTSFAPDGSTLVFSTYLGGGASESLHDLVYDDLGNLYAAGSTSSTDFPTTTGSYQATKVRQALVTNGYVSKFDPGGRFVYSTYYGGTAYSRLFGITLTAAREAVLVGETTDSNGFPKAGARSDDRSSSCCTIGAIAKLDAEGAAPLFSQTWGGLHVSDQTSLNSVAIDATGNIYASGYTSGYGALPCVDCVASLSPTGYEHFRDQVVMGLTADGQTLRLSSRLGGSLDYGWFNQGAGNSKVALEPGGSLWLAGYLVSGDDEVLIDPQRHDGQAALSQLARFSAPNGAGRVGFTAKRSFSPRESGFVVIEVTRVSGTADAFSVDYRSADDTAKANADYLPVSGTLSWADGEAGTQSITIQLQDDAFDESDDEYFSVTLSAPSNGVSLGNHPTVTVIIRDDDATPTFEVTPKEPAVGEGDGLLTLTVHRNGDADTASTLYYRSFDGGFYYYDSATAGEDYQATSGALVWQPGETADKTVSIPITQDRLGEKGESFTIQFNTGAPPTGVNGDGISRYCTIVDDDSAGQIAFKQSVFEVAENAVMATITVQRQGGDAGAVSVRYNTGDCCDAQGYLDYMPVSGTLNWADGDTVDKTFSVLLTDDPNEERDEQAGLYLTQPTGGATAATESAYLRILDNDQGGIIEFTAASYSADENAGTATITLTRNGSLLSTATVTAFTTADTATAGEDYAETSQTVTFEVGMSSASFTVPLNDDPMVEPGETVELGLRDPGTGASLGSRRSAELTIANDDAVGAISFAEAAITVTEGQGVVTLMLKRTGGNGAPGAVQLITADRTANAGSDYRAVQQSVSFAAGQNSASVTVPITNDTQVEGSETFTAQLSSPSAGGMLGSPAQATVTITDDDTTTKPPPASGGSGAGSGGSAGGGGGSTPSGGDSAGGGGGGGSFGAGLLLPGLLLAWRRRRASSAATRQPLTGPAPGLRGRRWAPCA